MEVARLMGHSSTFELVDKFRQWLALAPEIKQLPSFDIRYADPLDVKLPFLQYLANHAQLSAVPAEIVNELLIDIAGHFSSLSISMADEISVLLEIENDSSIITKGLFLLEMSSDGDITAEGIIDHMGNNSASLLASFQKTKYLVYTCTLGVAVFSHEGEIQWQLSLMPTKKSFARALQKKLLAVVSKVTDFKIRSSELFPEESSHV